MSTSTEKYHLPLHVDGRPFAVPRVRGHRRIEEWTKGRLVRVANTAWDVGAHHIITPFTNLLAPMSTVYTSDVNLVSSAHVNMGAKYSFIWFEAADAMRHSRAPVPNGAVYAVAFTIVTEVPHSSMALAFMLLRFQELFTREGNYQRFDMVDLCYMLTPDEVYGVMFFDVNFDAAFRFASERSKDLDDLQYARMGPFGSVVSVWNANLKTFAGSSANSLLAHIARYWAKTKQFLLPV